MGIRVLLLSLILSLSGVGRVQAMHETDHRYRVSGYVRDDLGEAKGDIDVFLEHKESNQKKKVKTNRWGYYEHVFHIHDSNLDDIITVTVGSDVKTHQVKFDPKDRVTDRSGTVDFGAPAADSGRGWIYGAVGGGAVLGVAIYFYRRAKQVKSVKKVKKRRDRHGK